MSARFQPRRWQPRLGGAYVAAVKRKKSARHQREKSSNCTVNIFSYNCTYDTTGQYIYTHAFVSIFTSEYINIQISNCLYGQFKKESEMICSIESTKGLMIYLTKKGF